MRSDGFPWLYYQISDRPQEGDLQAGSFSEDDLPDIIAQCLWMWQGVFSRADEIRNDVINLPHAFIPLREGIILTNVSTGRQYEIVKVLGQFRDIRYQKPPIDDVPESIKIPPRLWISGYHPDELTGGTVQIKPVDGIASIDLDRDKGHFLSLPASSRVLCRTIYSEIASEAEGKADEDRKAAIRNGYEIETVLARSGPNQGREHFGDTKSPKPRQYQGARVNTADKDPTLTNNIWSQNFDTHLEFNLKGPSAREVGWMAQWFQIFMWRYAPVIERVGFTQVFYDARFGGKVAPLRKPEAGDMTRLRYGIRWERLFPSRVVKLRKVTVKTEIARADGEPSEQLNPDIDE